MNFVAAMTVSKMLCRRSLWEVVRLFVFVVFAVLNVFAVSTVFDVAAVPLDALEVIDGEVDRVESLVSWLSELIDRRRLVMLPYLYQMLLF